MRIESLECRRLLTITLAEFDASSQTLRLVGNDKRDIVEVVPLAGGGVTATFDGRDVDYPGPIRLISINTGGAGDLISLATVADIPAFVDAGSGPDFIQGGLAGDTIIAGGGQDVALGGLGNDSIDGGLQGDLLSGSQGNDTIVAGSSDMNDDTITGGNGTDTVDFSTLTEPAIVNVGAAQPPQDESDKIFGDVEVLIGSALDDELGNGTKRGMRIDGGEGNDTITGGSGNDTLIGGAGDNVLNGVGGNDRFDVSLGGADTIDGGSGSDSVVGGDLDDLITHVP